MDSRAQFEEWFLVRYPLSRKGIEKYKDGDYMGQYAQSHWMAWQASRAAIEIELPEKISSYNTRESGYVIAQAAMYDEAIDDCADAIREIGISIKEELPLQHEAKEE